MKNNLRIVQINGIKGLCVALFIGSCLIAGFVAFPALVAMNIWNYFSLKTGSFPAITALQGLLLWAIIAFGSYIFSKRRFIISFNSQQELSDEEVMDMVTKIRTQSMHKHMIIPDKFNTTKDNKENNIEVPPETSEK